MEWNGSDCGTEDRYCCLILNPQQNSNDIGSKGSSDCDLKSNHFSQNKYIQEQHYFRSDWTTLNIWKITRKLIDINKEVIKQNAAWLVVSQVTTIRGPACNLSQESNGGILYHFAQALHCSTKKTSTWSGQFRLDHIFSVPGIEMLSPAASSDSSLVSVNVW